MGALARAALAATVALGAAGTAAAQCTPPRTLDCRLAAKPRKVKLGDPVTFTVTIANLGDAPARIEAPQFDYQSVGLRIHWLEPLPQPEPPAPKAAPPGKGKGGTAAKDGQAPKPAPRTHRRREARIERYHPRYRAPRQPDIRSIPPHEAMTLEIVLPMVHTGAVTVEALFNGFGVSNKAGANVGTGIPLPFPIATAPLKSDPVTITVASTPKNQLGAVIATDLGNIEVELFPNRAPNHVINFLALARRKFYDNSYVPRILADFVMQGGDPDGTRAGNPGYSIPAEFNFTEHVRGTLSMARGQDAYSAGCQFFICFTDCPQLDLVKGFREGFPCTPFGRMTAGDDVLTKFAQVQVEPVSPVPNAEKSKPVEPVMIKTITPFVR